MNFGLHLKNSNPKKDHEITFFFVKNPNHHGEIYAEAVLRRCSWEKFWNYATNLQENNHAEV